MTKLPSGFCDENTIACTQFATRFSKFSPHGLILLCCMTIVSSIICPSEKWCLHAEYGCSHPGLPGCYASCTWRPSSQSRACKAEETAAGQWSQAQRNLQEDVWLSHAAFWNLFIMVLVSFLSMQSLGKWINFPCQLKPALSKRSELVVHWLNASCRDLSVEWMFQAVYSSGL